MTDDQAAPGGRSRNPCAGRRLSLRISISTRSSPPPIVPPRRRRDRAPTSATQGCEKSAGDWVTAADVASESAVRSCSSARRGFPCSARRRAATAPKSAGSSTRSTASNTARPRSGRRLGRSRRRRRPVVGVVRAAARPHAQPAGAGRSRRTPSARERPGARQAIMRPDSPSATRICWLGTSCVQRRSTRSRICAGSVGPASTCAGPPKRVRRLLQWPSGRGTWPPGRSSCGKRADRPRLGTPTWLTSGNILAGPRSACDPRGVASAAEIRR